MNNWNKNEDPIMFYKDCLSDGLRNKITDFINDESEFVNLIEAFEKEVGEEESLFEGYAEKWLKESVDSFIKLIEKYQDETTDEVEIETYSDQIEWAKNLIS